MATLSFSSSRISNGSLSAKRNGPRSGNNPMTILIAAVFALSGCSNLQTRDSVTGQAGKTGTRPGTTTGAPPATMPSAEPSPAESTAQTPTQPAAPLPAPSQPPTFLGKELPKVGVILGAGGMKTYAHIGVLREFNRARIPIHAVAGLEWGAIIGGLFATQGQVNDAEWKAFKLKDSEIPTEGLLSSSKPQSISTLSSFLDTAFGGASIDKAKIEFGCPAYWSKQDRFGWMAKGSFKEAMRACVPYPPLYTDNGGVLASPFSIDEAAAWLRGKGANVIVLVNVIKDGEIVPSRRASDQPAEGLVWSEIRRQMLRAKSPLVTHVINVNTQGHPLTDFAGRRALMDVGSKSAADVVSKMASQYGF